MKKNKPTFEEFEFYIRKQNFKLNPKEVFDEFERRNWKTKKGQPAKTWQALVNSLNGIVNKGSSPHKNKQIAYIEACTNSYKLILRRGRTEVAITYRLMERAALLTLY